MNDFSISPVDVIVIGGSAGSLDIILRMLPALQPSFRSSIILVLHRKRHDDAVLVDLLADRSPVPVRESEEKDTMEPGTIYLAPADYHLLLEKNGSFSLDYSEKVHYCRPSIDVCFESVSQVYERNMAAILLSGANSDGVEGLNKVHANGGQTIVQSPSFAAVDYMPKQAIRHAKVDHVFEIHETESLLNRLGRFSF